MSVRWCYQSNVFFLNSGFKILNTKFIPSINAWFFSFQNTQFFFSCAHASIWPAQRAVCDELRHWRGAGGPGMYRPGIHFWLVPFRFSHADGMNPPDNRAESSYRTVPKYPSPPPKGTKERPKYPVFEVWEAPHPCRAHIFYLKLALYLAPEIMAYSPADFLRSASFQTTHTLDQHWTLFFNEKITTISLQSICCPLTAFIRQFFSPKSCDNLWFGGKLLRKMPNFSCLVWKWKNVEMQQQSGARASSAGRVGDPRRPRRRHSKPSGKALQPRWQRHWLWHYIFLSYARIFSTIFSIYSSIPHRDLVVVFFCRPSRGIFQQSSFSPCILKTSVCSYLHSVYPNSWLLIGHMDLEISVFLFLIQLKKWQCTNVGCRIFLDHCRETRQPSFAFFPSTLN